MAAGVVAAIAATMLYKLGVVLQKTQAERATRGGLRILGFLARRPVWLLGIAIQLGGFALHYFALTRAPVVVVQPIIASGIVFVVIFAALLLGERPGRRELAGMALSISGVTLLVAQVEGTAPMQEIPGIDLSTVVIAVAAAIAGLLALARWRRGGRAGVHAVLIGSASGLGQGMSDAMNRLLGAWLTPRAGWIPPAPMGLAAGLLLLLFGFSGFVVAQNAYRSHRANTVVPCIVTAQLLVPVLIAILLYGQPLPASAAERVAWVAGFGLAGAGVLTLARSSAVASRFASGPDYPSPRVS